MEINKLLEVCHLGEKLKNNTRHSWTSNGKHESIADHSWRISMMAYFMKDEFADVDIDKVIKMCIFHDIGEAFTGDIAAFNKTDEDTKIEDEYVFNWIKDLPQPYRDELKILFEEMNALETKESKLYKALDKMEAVIQHNEANIRSWLPNEYSLQKEYGINECSFDEYIKELREKINEDVDCKINNEC